MKEIKEEQEGLKIKKQSTYFATHSDIRMSLFCSTVQQMYS
jgi:hypothetical protein